MLHPLIKPLSRADVQLLWDLILAPISGLHVIEMPGIPLTGRLVIGLPSCAHLCALQESSILGNYWTLPKSKDTYPFVSYFEVHCQAISVQISKQCISDTWTYNPCIISYCKWLKYLIYNVKLNFVLLHKRVGKNTIYHSNDAYQFIGAMFSTLNVHFVINLSISSRRKHPEQCSRIFTEWRGIYAR